MDNDTERWLMVRDVADLLHWHENSVRDALSQGRLSGAKVRGRWYVRMAELDALRDRQGSEHEAKSRQPGQEATRCAAEIADRGREGEERLALAKSEQQAKGELAVESEQQAKEELETEEQQRGEKHHAAANQQRIRLEVEQQRSRERSRSLTRQKGNEPRRGRSRSLGG